ncbi:MAG: ABC transporter permease [Actinomycetota bacterium]|nr:ABC transporter permease [Acidimicrobiales bacterium]MEC8814289.1 ABC transporter permease [Actinomycetota bacterium]MEC8971152.1 ABC transporter permease [Actinomycetota bacterium]
MVFLARRLAFMLGVLLTVTFLLFAAMNVLGDPLFNVVGFYAAVDCDAVLAGEIEDVAGMGGTSFGDCQVVAAAKEKYHLNDPLPVQYGHWIANMFQGDFGRSYKNNMAVSTILGERLPKSLLLMGMSVVVALGVSIPWAVAAAYRANRRLDRASTAGAFGLLSIPNFALGVIFFYFFVVRWQIFPSRFMDDNLGSRLHSLILPAATLGLPLAAVYQRLLRTDLITTLQEDYVIMAKAKGLSDRWIMFRHVLRPSLFGMVTVVGLNTSALIGGSIIIEQIFNIPGVGRELYVSMVRDDYTVVLAAAVVLTAGFVIINTAVDLFYSYLDPRVSRDA